MKKEKDQVAVQVKELSQQNANELKELEEQHDKLVIEQEKAKKQIEENELKRR